MSISPLSWSAANPRILSRRTHQWKKFVTRRLCKNCNEVWLSRLEDLVRPIILNLADSDGKVKTLAVDQQFLLGRWAIKTAMMLNRTASSIPQLPRNLFWEFFSNSESFPKGFSVFAFQCPFSGRGAPIDGLVTQKWTVYAPHGAVIGMSAAAAAAQKLSLQINNLQLLVCYCGDPAVRLIGWKGVHWPLSGSQKPLFFDFGLRKQEVTERSTSCMTLFHLSLCLSRGCEQGDIFQIRPPVERWHEDFYRSYSEATGL